ncbi:hypothetical protein SEF58_08870 [Neomoorella humiferrea]|uniref:hypothetical protein n=1 Tax=Neomoorella humiferrea TaxID=676965 RepID=UPI003D8AAD96
MNLSLKIKPGLRRRVPALLSWLLLLLFLASVLAGCSGSQDASQTLPQGTASSNKNY